MKDKFVRLNDDDAVINLAHLVMIRKEIKEPVTVNDRAKNGYRTASKEIKEPVTINDRGKNECGEYRIVLCFTSTDAAINLLFKNRNEMEQGFDWFVKQWTESNIEDIITPE
ncbi:MAG: hypothetical protein LBQ01_06215 [Prevotellaceae bacterium]|jgi:hypothetical protein|nr:hypothetical protein [Prevotellaceae bacterium]